MQMRSRLRPGRVQSRSRRGKACAGEKLLGYLPYRVIGSAACQESRSERCGPDGLHVALEHVHVRWGGAAARNRPGVEPRTPCSPAPVPGEVLKECPYSTKPKASTHATPLWLAHAHAGAHAMVRAASLRMEHRRSAVP